MEEIVTRFLSLRAGALLAALWLPSIGATQSQDPQALAQAFASAWNAHDADAFLKATRHSGQWTIVAGQVASRRSRTSQ